VGPLVNHFVDRFNRELGRSVKGVTQGLLTALREHPWPGNVRELRNVIEGMVLFAKSDELDVADLPADFGTRRSSLPGPQEPGQWRPRTMADIEKEAIMRALQHTGGHRAKAAQLLDIGLRTLQRKLKEYGDTDEGGE